MSEADARRRSRRRATPSTSSRSTATATRSTAEQGRQEGRDLLRREDARAGEDRDREVAACAPQRPAAAASPVWDRGAAAALGARGARRCSTRRRRRRRCHRRSATPPSASSLAAAGCGPRSPAARPACAASSRRFAGHSRTCARARRAPPGHDPLGVWMIWLLWSLVLLLGVTGWMSRLDAFWGDDGIHEVHALARRCAARRRRAAPRGCRGDELALAREPAGVDAYRPEAVSAKPPPIAQIAGSVSA